LVITYEIVYQYADPQFEAQQLLSENKNIIQPFKVRCECMKLKEGVSTLVIVKIDLQSDSYGASSIFLYPNTQ
jgi:hypothetical protein